MRKKKQEVNEGVDDTTTETGTEMIVMIAIGREVVVMDMEEITHQAQEEDTGTIVKIRTTRLIATGTEVGGTKGILADMTIEIGIGTGTENVEDVMIVRGGTGRRVAHRRWRVGIGIYPHETQGGKGTDGLHRLVDAKPHFGHACTTTLVYCMIYHQRDIMYRVPGTADGFGLEISLPAETRVIVIYHRLTAGRFCLLYLSLPYTTTITHNTTMSWFR